MIPYRFTIIAKEGWPPIIICIVFALILQYVFGWLFASVIWLLVVVLMFLFRDPPRKVPPSPLALVAPVDGKVIAVRKGSGPYLERETIAIKIRASATGVYTVRSPNEGKVLEQWFSNPPNVSDLVSEKDRMDLQFAQWVKTDEGDDIVVVLKPRVRIGKSRCYVHSGERIGQGQRCTFVPFGANTEMFIPDRSHLEVKEGDIVRAGETVVATLAR